MLQAKQVEDEYNKLVKTEGKPIKENAIVQSHLKWSKAVNDLLLAESLLRISTDVKVKEILKFPNDTTFFDWVVVRWKKSYQS